MRPVSLLDSKPFQELIFSNSSDSSILRTGGPTNQPTHPVSTLICFFQRCRPGGTARNFTFKTQAATRWPFQASIMMHSEPPMAMSVDFPSREHLALQRSQTTRHTATRQASRTPGRPRRDSFKHKTSPCPGHNKCRCRWLPRVSLCGSIRSVGHLKLGLLVSLPDNHAAFRRTPPFKISWFPPILVPNHLDAPRTGPLQPHKLPQPWLVALVYDSSHLEQHRHLLVVQQ